MECVRDYVRTYLHLSSNHVLPANEHEAFFSQHHQLSLHLYDGHARKDIAPTRLFIIARNRCRRVALGAKVSHCIYSEEHRFLVAVARANACSWLSLASDVRHDQNNSILKSFCDALMSPRKMFARRVGAEKARNPYDRVRVARTKRWGTLFRSLSLQELKTFTSLTHCADEVGKSLFVSERGDRHAASESSTSDGRPCSRVPRRIS